MSGTSDQTETSQSGWRKPSRAGTSRAAADYEAFHDVIFSSADRPNNSHPGYNDVIDLCDEPLLPADVGDQPRPLVIDAADLSNPLTIAYPCALNHNDIPFRSLQEAYYCTTAQRQGKPTFCSWIQQQSQDIDITNIFNLANKTLFASTNQNSPMDRTAEEALLLSLIKAKKVQCANFAEAIKGTPPPLILNRTLDNHLGCGSNDVSWFPGENLFGKTLLKFWKQIDARTKAPMPSSSNAEMSTAATKTHPSNPTAGRKQRTKAKAGDKHKHRKRDTEGERRSPARVKTMDGHRASCRHYDSPSQSRNEGGKRPTRPHERTEDRRHSHDRRHKDRPPDRCHDHHWHTSPEARPQIGSDKDRTSPDRRHKYMTSPDRRHKDMTSPDRRHKDMTSPDRRHKDMTSPDRRHKDRTSPDRCHDHHWHTPPETRSQIGSDKDRTSPDRRHQIKSSFDRCDDHHWHTPPDRIERHGSPEDRHRRSRRYDPDNRSSSGSHMAPRSIERYYESPDEGDRDRSTSSHRKYGGSASRSPQYRLDYGHSPRYGGHSPVTRRPERFEPSYHDTGPDNGARFGELSHAPRKDEASYRRYVGKSRVHHFQPRFGFYRPRYGFRPYLRGRGRGSWFNNDRYHVNNYAHDKNALLYGQSSPNFIYIPEGFPSKNEDHQPTQNTGTPGPHYVNNDERINVPNMPEPFRTDHHLSPSATPMNVAAERGLVVIDSVSPVNASLASGTDNAGADSLSVGRHSATPESRAPDQSPGVISETNSKDISPQTRYIPATKSAISTVSSALESPETLGSLTDSVPGLPSRSTAPECPDGDAIEQGGAPHLLTEHTVKSEPVESPCLAEFRPPTPPVYGESRPLLFPTDLRDVLADAFRIAAEMRNQLKEAGAPVANKD